MAISCPAAMHSQALMRGGGDCPAEVAPRQEPREIQSQAHCCLATGWPSTVVRLDGPTSLDDLRQGADVDGDSGISPLTLPQWMDFGRYDRGRAFFREHTFSLVMAWHSSLIIGFSLPELLAALVFTGASDTPEESLKRYVRTFQHLAHWHLGNVFDPASPAFTAVHQVRTLHHGVRGAMEKKMPGKRWITMYDMACVQAGFIGISIASSKFGARASAKSLDDYLFFWKCVGYQLGISDRFNTCSLGKSISDKLIHEVFDNVVLPDIAAPPEDYQRIAGAYISGLNLMAMGVPIFSVPSSLAIVYWALGRPRGRLGWLDTGRYCFLRLLLLLVQFVPPFRWLVNRAVIFSVGRFPDAGGPGPGGRGAAARCPFSGASLHLPPSALPLVACPHAQQQNAASAGRPRCTLAGAALLTPLALALLLLALLALCAARLALLVAWALLAYLYAELSSGHLARRLLGLLSAALGGGA